MITIQELESVNSSASAQLDTLISQLSSRLNLTQERLLAVIESTGSHLFIIQEDGSIIGMATLSIYEALSGLKGVIEDVVIDERHRGRGLGCKLIEHIIEFAKSSSPIDLNLTSKPARTAANKLYQKVGFSQKETNVYVLKL